MDDLINTQVNQFLLRFHWETMIFSTIRITLIIASTWLLTMVLRKVVKRMLASLAAQDGQTMDSKEAAKRAETLFLIVRQFITLGVWVIASLMILKEIGLEIGPILASAGVVGLAVGFGAQNLVRDMITGFFLILENQVRVGDVVNLNGTGGLVERINLRTITIRDLSGVVHIFPNGAITSVSNLTYEWSAYVFDIGVAYNSDIDKVIKILETIGAEMKDDPAFGPHILNPIEIFGLDKFGESELVIKGRFKTAPIQQWAVGREFLRRVKLAFDSNGIEIPFPQRTLHMKQE